MTRNWGLPSKEERLAIRDAKTAKPVMTLFVSALFGIIGAAVAAFSFAEAKDQSIDLFHGASLVMTIISAGFGCWAYIWLARPRFAAQFSGKGDAFSSLLRFYVRATIALFVILVLGLNVGLVAPDMLGIMLLCISGGAGAAAAFQTVLAFVPYYE